MQLQLIARAVLVRSSNLAMHRTSINLTHHLALLTHIGHTLARWQFNLPSRDNCILCLGHNRSCNALCTKMGWLWIISLVASQAHTYVHTQTYTNTRTHINTQTQTYTLHTHMHSRIVISTTAPQRSSSSCWNCPAGTAAQCRLTLIASNWEQLQVRLLSSSLSLALPLSVSLSFAHSLIC